MVTSTKSLIKSTIIVMATVFMMLAIIAIIVLFGKKTIDTTTQNKIKHIQITELNLETYKTAIKSFAYDNDRLPTQEEGLEVLINNIGNFKNFPDGGYLDNATFMDSWGSKIIYILEPDGEKNYFEIKSYGPDKKDRGDDDIIERDFYFPSKNIINKSYK